MTNEEAIDRIRKHMERHGIDKYPGTDLTDALNMAIEALSVNQFPDIKKMTDHFPDFTKMVPLTVEQLKQVQPEHPILVLVRCIDERTGEPDPQDEDFEIWDGRCFANADTYDSLENYGKTFLAYPYYPDHIDRVAWVDVKERMPEDDQVVLVIANGKPVEHLTLKDAYELAEWSKDDGWILECWPVWDGAVVTHWMPLPKAPAELEKRMGVRE